MRIAILIVNFNGGQYIGACLSSIRQSTFRPSSVVVFDNASVDGSRDLIARDFPEVQLIASAVNVGFTGGVNASVARALEAGCDGILLLNPDAQLAPATLEALVEAAARHPGAVLSPMIVFADRPDILDSYVGRVVWWRGRSSAIYFGRRRSDVPDIEQRVETASGCCLYIPAPVARDVGPLDDAYFLYFEDMDFLERAARNGHQVWYIPSAVVRHQEGAATGGPPSSLAIYYYIRNRHYFVRKFKRGTAVHAVFLAYSFAHTGIRALRDLVQGRVAPARAALRGFRDALRGVVGPSA